LRSQVNGGLSGSHRAISRVPSFRVGRHRWRGADARRARTQRVSRSGPSHPNGPARCRDCEPGRRTCVSSALVENRCVANQCHRVEGVGLALIQLHRSRRVANLDRFRTDGSERAVHDERISVARIRPRRLVDERRAWAGKNASRTYGRTHSSHPRTTRWRASRPSTQDHRRCLARSRHHRLCT